MLQILGHGVVPPAVLHATGGSPSLGSYEILVSVSLTVKTMASFKLIWVISVLGSIDDLE